ncbi:MAG TPA: methionyl-tRNA formyltransferase [Holosporales bacterium]|nr:methionyl-tRNA formyltransferase [Holosporales bacterium]
MLKKPLRIAFMGTPDFSVPALQALIGSPHEVVAVYSQPPRPSGRGHKVTKSPIQLLAEANDISVFTPKSLRSSQEQQHFSNLNLDLAVVAAYGLILPKETLEAPRYGCFNIHASLLPRWRGAAPIQRAILGGDSETGITLMQMDIGLDTGNMLAKETLAITDQTTGESLHEALSSLGAKMLLPLLDSIDQLSPETQNDTKATYAAKLTKAEAELDFTKTAQDLDRQVRAFTPWPGSFFKWQDKVIKVLKTHVVEETQGAKAGTLHVTKNQLSIVCKEGALSLDCIQLQGKKPMEVAAFLNGYKPQNGDVIEVKV